MGPFTLALTSRCSQLIIIILMPAALHVARATNPRSKRTRATTTCATFIGSKYTSYSRCANVGKVRVQQGMVIMCAPLCVCMQSKQ